MPACVFVAMLPVLLHSTGAAPVIRDIPFWQDVHQSVPEGATDIRALVNDADGVLWAATGAGVRYLERGSWHTPPGQEAAGPCTALCRDSAGGMYAGAWNGLWHVTREGTRPAGLGEQPVGATAASEAGTVFAGGPNGIWKYTRGAWQKVPGVWHSIVRSIYPASDTELWVGTASGLYRVRSAAPAAGVTCLSRPPEILSSSVNCISPMPGGQMAVGTTGGIDIYRAGRRVRSFSALNGLPFRSVTSLSVDGEGRIWAGSPLGVMRYDGSRWSVRSSRRWLQNDDVRAVVTAGDGSAWVGTAAGVDRIDRVRLTLEQKSDRFIAIMRARHMRAPGLTGPAVLVTNGDLSRSFIEDDDNDGEHTGMYCAAELMRYAVTHAPDARANAAAAYRALVALRKVTGTSWFIARSMLPTGTAPRHETDRTFTPQEIAETHRTDPREKIIEKRWVPSADGKWLWKRDASSDEVDGHMFASCMFYDLAADDEDKKLVAEHVGSVIGGIMEHGYKLQDIDGAGTRWGNWSPDSLNGDANWREERPGNSVEMLAYLGLALHVTGDQKYRTAAESLIRDHGYARNILDTRFDTPSEHTHIEDELLSMVYTMFLSHLPEPGLSAAAHESLRQWHSVSGHDGIPFYDFVFRHFSGSPIPLERGVAQLRDWPLDLIEWTVDNSRREDTTIDRTPGSEQGLLTKILPRDEMGLTGWDGEPYRAVIGNGGQREDRPGDWLLAYWMGRYWGLIGTPETGSP